MRAAVPAALTNPALPSGSPTKTSTLQAVVSKPPVAEMVSVQVSVRMLLEKVSVMYVFRLTEMAGNPWASVVIPTFTLGSSTNAAGLLSRTEEAVPLAGVGWQALVLPTTGITAAGDPPAPPFVAVSSCKKKT